MTPRSIIIAFLLLLLWVGSFSSPASAELIRKPMWAGRFYPSDPEDLAETIDALSQKARKTRIELPEGRRLRALVLPHAGYIYSGWTAAHASRVVDAGEFTKVVLIGPDHRIGFAQASVSEAMAWETPLGVVHLHPDAARLRERSPRFRSVPESDRVEHSLEVILPFLQRYLDRFTIVPIVIGSADPGPVADDLAPLIDDRTLLVISSDLSHYLPYDQAVRTDRDTVERILQLDAAGLLADRNRACGALPIAVGLELANRYHWKPVLLHYSNSGDTAGGRDRVVGYAAIAFFGEPMSQISTPFDESQGRTLVDLARRTLQGRFGQTTAEEALTDRLSDPCFDVARGTFVTLKLDNQLRGCIGTLSGEEPVRENVKRNAINAAFHDPRFPPLREAELDRVQIEVSVLTDPRPLSYADAADLAMKLRPGIDGVIIRRGPAQATFLPQVWEQLPEPESFLGHLCMKAGLSTDAWRRGDLEVLTYQVQYFEEPR